MTSGTCSIASAIPSAPVDRLDGLESVRAKDHPSELPVGIAVVDDQATGTGRILRHGDPVVLAEDH
jgi:hypothetical protein